jgi:hypothetical protein
LAGCSGGGDLYELAGFYVVDVAVDRDGLRHERAAADAGYVGEDGVGLVFDGEEFDELGCGRARAFAYVFEALGGEGGGFEAVGEEATDDIVREELHAAVGVVDDEEFLRAEKLVADDEGADGVVRGAAAGVADDVGVSFSEACVFGGVEAGVHAGEDGEAAGWREGEVGFVAEGAGVLLVGGENFVEDLTHAGVS